MLESNSTQREKGKADEKITKKIIFTGISHKIIKVCVCPVFNS